jgi:hypothetical protein
MKKLLMAAVLVLAACGEKQADTPAVDTTSAVSPEPAHVAPDTSMMAPAGDTGMVHSDSAMARDTTAR